MLPKVHLTKQPLLFKVPASIAGWSSLVARRAHNPKVRGSNPLPATIISRNFFVDLPHQLSKPGIDVFPRTSQHLNIRVNRAIHWQFVILFE